MSVGDSFTFSRVYNGTVVYVTGESPPDMPGSISEQATEVEAIQPLPVSCKTNAEG
jgi:hypothetical protein